MRREGTKLTQGINGQAAALQRHLEAAITVKPTSTIVYEPCGYETHRPAHCVFVDGPLACTACHPLPAGHDHVIYRGQPDFDELAAAARARMSGRRPRCTCGTVLESEEARKTGTCGTCRRVAANTARKAAEAKKAA